MIENEGQSGQEQPQINEPAPLVSALAGFVSPETLAKIEEVEATKVVNTNPEGQEEKKETPVQKENPKAAEAEEGQEGSEEGAEGEKKPEEKKPEQKEEKKSVFGLNKPKGKQQDIVVENIEQALEVVKSKFGIEAKEVKDLPKFFESAQKWRADAQKAETLEKENSNYKNILENTPAEIIDAMKMHFEGQDYTKAFANKPKFDYNKPVEKQDIKELVNHYYPGKFTEEDFTDEEPSSALEIAISSAQDKFNIEKQSIDARRATETEKANKRLESFKSSVNGSVEHLKRNFPDMTTDDIQDVKSVIEGGPNAILSFFMNQDGTVKQEAAEMLAMAKHGKSEIERMMEAASNQTEGRINEEIVTRGADGPKPKKSAATETLSEEARRVMNELGSFKKTRTF